MQLIESYLIEVGQHLPREQRADILSELRDELVEQLNALAEAAGRAPDTEDERCVLGRLGHPVKVAGSYAARRYLVGPGLYPAYLKTLRTVVGVVLAVALLIWIAVGADSGGSYSLKGLLNLVFNLGFWVVLVTTGVFLALEASGEKLGWYHNWTPDQLKPNANPLVYSDLVINLVTEGVFLLLWNSLLSISWGADPQWLAGLSYAPIWQDLFWPGNLVIGGLFCLHVVVLVQGVWRRWSAGLELLLCVLLFALLGRLFFAGDLVTSELDSTSNWVTQSLRITILVVAGFTLWDAKLAFGRWRTGQVFELLSH